MEGARYGRGAVSGRFDFDSFSTSPRTGSHHKAVFFFVVLCGPWVEKAVYSTFVFMVVGVVRVHGRTGGLHGRTGGLHLELGNICSLLIAG